MDFAEECNRECIDISTNDKKQYASGWQFKNAGQNGFVAATHVEDGVQLL
jgi:hypothetical protein